MYCVGWMYSFTSCGLWWSCWSSRHFDEIRSRHQFCSKGEVVWEQCWLLYVIVQQKLICMYCVGWIYSFTSCCSKWSCWSSRNFDWIRSRDQFYSKGEIVWEHNWLLYITAQHKLICMYYVEWMDSFALCCSKWLCWNSGNFNQIRSGHQCWW